MDKKIKVLMLGDHAFSPSGCGNQIRYISEALVRSGKFKIVQLGGAIKHSNYNPVKTEEFQDDWIIYPVDGYGNKDIIRSMLRMERPDILWMMTDPRFFTWLWDMEDEIRKVVPLVYYHVWDNHPYPTFNKSFYESNDCIATISKVTDDIVRTVSPSVMSRYLPHAVDTSIFKPLDEEEVKKFRKQSLLINGKPDMNRVIFFWNNRNARRKQSGTLLFWFKEFLNIVGSDKASLIMHTDPKDPNGQDLEAIVESLEMTNGEVLFSRDKLPLNHLAMMYNMVDCTINISDAEGFGLATLESLACGTPIIVNMTGGLQEQVTDGSEWFGIGIQPSSRAVIGSQDIPWIYEDRINKDDFINSLLTIFRMSREERKALGSKGMQHVLKNYNFKDFEESWVSLMQEVHEKCGSWGTRERISGYEFIEIK